MSDLGYVRAHNLREALDLLNEPAIRSRVLAGGTDLVRAIRRRAVDADRVVDISRLAELQHVESIDASRLRLGAGVTFGQVLREPLLTAGVPLLAEACRSVGSVQIRNRATVGGNVANRAACADCATALVCLEAMAVIAGAAGERRMPVSELLAAGAGDLLPGELLQAFEFRLPPETARSAYLRLGRRQGMSLARVSIAALGDVGPDGRVRLVRLAVGSVFEYPRRLCEIEARLTDELPVEAALLEAGRALGAMIAAQLGDRWSTPYKQRVAPALLERGLRSVLGAGA